MKPFKHKEAVGIPDFLSWGLTLIISAYLLAYGVATYMHHVVTKQYQMIANSYIDVITENREITTEQGQYFCSQLARSSWYAKGEYTIKFQKITFENGTYSTEVVATIEDGDLSTFTPIKLQPGTLIHVEICSGTDTFLSRVTNMMGKDYVVETLGFSEGMVH